MKALSKPLSSPNRAEKFPPPLMRFLRSNVGSRSRGRSRSSPMFYLRSKKRVPGVIETTQEPSSPKVTCIGQVRVRRSAKSKAKKTGGAAANRRRCWWFKKTLCCGKISSSFRRQKRPRRRVFSFCKWGLFSRSGYRKKVDATEDSFRAYSKSEKNENLVFAGNNRNSSTNSESDYSRNKYENLGDVVQEIQRDFLKSSSSPPPKNALLLTRSRSAPYRSSSLGGRFWGSPLAEEKKENEAENEEKSEELQKPIISEENSKNLEEKSVNEVQDLKAIIGGGAVHPLLLTRCKSEPARTGERLIPEAKFLRERRLD